MKTCLPLPGFLLATAFVLSVPRPGMAQGEPIAAQSGEDTPSVQPAEGGVVSFPAEFFRRYQPNTALNIVNRVPGFTLDDGGDKRGFGGAAGNVLINDRRPSTKQDAPSAILNRISADQVESVELIRVRVRDIDLQGRSEVINVVLRADAPAAIRWEVYFRFNLDLGTSPFAGMSVSDRWADIEYNIGFDTRYSRFGDPGTIRSFNGDGVLSEIRVDDDHAEGPDFNVYLNASRWFGKNFVQLNTKINKENRDIFLDSTRTPQNPIGDPFEQKINTLRRNKRLEIGLDGERVLSPISSAKRSFYIHCLTKARHRHRPILTHPECRHDFGLRMKVRHGPSLSLGSSSTGLV